MLWFMQGRRNSVGNHGFLKHLIETLIADEAGLIDLLTKPSGNIRSMYVYESKINLLDLKTMAMYLHHRVCMYRL